MSIESRIYFDAEKVGDREQLSEVQLVIYEGQLTSILIDDVEYELKEYSADVTQNLIRVTAPLLNGGGVI